LQPPVETALTFHDESFDLLLTQDVLEHVFDADAVFREIARVLRPGGMHVFTVPYWPARSTVVRARRSGSDIEHLEQPSYHFDPGDPRGALVVRDWGNDLAAVIERSTGLSTRVYDAQDRRRGIIGEMSEVFVTRKDHSRQRGSRRMNQSRAVSIGASSTTSNPTLM
jgi:SAM-dependent methyltransferase